MINFGYVLAPSYIPSPIPNITHFLPRAGVSQGILDVGDPDGSPGACTHIILSV